MSRHNVSAVTLPGCNYPAFLSVNHEEGGQVEFTVRSAAKEDGSCGDIATMKMDMKDFREVARQLFSFGCTNRA